MWGGEEVLEWDVSLGYETGLVTSGINKVSTCYTCNKSREAIFAGQTQVQALIKQSQFQNLSDDLRFFIFALPGGSSATTFLSRSAIDSVRRRK